MKYDVLATAMNRSTRQMVGPIRTERIDTRANPLFRDARSPLGVERAYEAFWNDLNPTSAEIVKVLSVTEAD